jgi:hypothetical protein
MNDLPDDLVRDASPVTETQLSGQDWLSSPQSPTDAVSVGPAFRSTRADVACDAVRALLAEQRLERATAFALDLLNQRIDVGDGALDAVRLVLEHYVMIVAQLAPLAHLGCAPLRPDDRLYRCFSEFVEMVHRQDGQIRELQSIIAEMV